MLRYGTAQIALFRVETSPDANSLGEKDTGSDDPGDGNERVGSEVETRWFATQNACPHKRDMVLSRGIVGDEAGRLKVACPQHKKTFCLRSGAGLSDPSLQIATFPVEIRDGQVNVLLPPAEQLAPQAT